MRHLRYVLPFLLGLILVACSQDPIVESLAEQDPTATAVDSETLLAEAKAEVAAARAEIAAETEAVAKGPAVYVPAGSTDELAAALAAAGPNGRVILESGAHYESETVVISQRIWLEGEPGAVLYSSAAAADQVSMPIPVIPAIHVKGADQARISGLDIQPTEGQGSSGILVEDSRNVRIHNNGIEGFAQGIVLFGTEHAKVVGNKLSGIGTAVGYHGVLVIKGRFIRVFDNDVSGFDTGIFTSDYKGMASGNYTHGNSVGVLVCTAPPNYEAPDGTIMQAPVSSNEWLILGNNCSNNALTGCTIIDGSFENLILQNEATGNGVLDIVLFPAVQGETMFFPVTFDNHVISTAFPNVTIMDCGDNNTVTGGIAIDCFL